jgi:hypothetical protein
LGTSFDADDDNIEEFMDLPLNQLANVMTDNTQETGEVEFINTTTTQATISNAPVLPTSNLVSPATQNQITTTNEATTTIDINTIVVTPAAATPTATQTSGGGGSGQSARGVTFSDGTSVRSILRTPTPPATFVNNAATWATPIAQQATTTGAFAGVDTSTSTPTNSVLPPRATTPTVPTPITTPAPVTAATMEVPDWMRVLLQQQAASSAQQNDTMAKFVQIHQESKQGGSGDGQNWERRFPETTRNAFLFMSSSVDRIAPEEPNDEFKLFLETPASQIVTSAKQSINDRRGGSQTIDKPYATALHNLNFHNTNNLVPSGLSIFFANPALSYNGNETMSEAEFNLRVQFNVSINTSQIQTLTKSAIGIPRTLGDLKDTLSNQLKMFALAVTEEAYLYYGLAILYNAMNTYHQQFAACVNDTSEPTGTFIPALMARIDVRFANFVSSCYRAKDADDIDWEAWDFTSEIKNIKLANPIKSGIPPAVKAIMTKYAAEKEKAANPRQGKRGGAGGDEDTPQGNGRNQKQRNAAGGATKEAINTDKTFSIDVRESTVCYFRNLDAAPVLEEQKPCLRYLLKNKCTYGKSCKYAAWHTKSLPAEIKTEFTKWLAQSKTKFAKEAKD